jgi:uncharacterized protein (DUF433 family)
MFARIVSNPAILGGKPVIKGTRISVELILEWMASGASRDEIIARHPHLSAEDVEQALAFASGDSTSAMSASRGYEERPIST